MSASGNIFVPFSQLKLKICPHFRPKSIFVNRRTRLAFTWPGTAGKPSKKQRNQRLTHQTFSRLRSISGRPSRTITVCLLDGCGNCMMIQPLIRHALRDRLQSVRQKIRLRNFTRYGARRPTQVKMPGRPYTPELGTVSDNANKIEAKYRYWTTTTAVYTTLQTLGSPDRTGSGIFIIR